MYTEKQPWGETKYDILPNSHITFQTQKQKVDLITNPHFGRMLFLDGVLQCTTADEVFYHYPIVTYCMKHRQQPRILIAGGAEGAVLREIQDHDGKYDLGVKEMVMVDWDEELVNYLRDEEGWSHGSFDEPRLKSVFEDIHTFLERDTQPFDTIILDLLDIQSEEELEWMKQVVFKALSKLNVKGCLSMNAGCHPDLVKKLVDSFEDKYNVRTETIQVPSYQEPLYLVFMSALEEVEDQGEHRTNPEK
jgi:spermidine synthase